MVEDDGLFALLVTTRMEYPVVTEADSKAIERAYLDARFDIEWIDD